uniref:Uncharacterized protein n=1 Tax=viral metagenome TaxID=1070528 RepID=A0A6C0JR13_9ZZZZ
MVSDTEPLGKTQKVCSRCGETKSLDRIVKNRNVCKDCCNTRKKEKYKALVIDNETNQTCTICAKSKPQTSFIKRRTVCKDCNNEKRKERYNSNEEHRKKVIKQASEFKHTKVIERRNKKMEEIGEGNKKCSVCSKIKSKDRFRHNRLRCKDCERDDPIEKFKRNVRSRIHTALKQNKEMHTVKYLGCTSSEYLQWILTYDVNYNLDNHGKVWHIDHVIPLSRFNLEDKEEQMIAFNWRNTMPLSAKENLSKNAKIVKPQIEQHLKYLKDYHEEKNIELPQKFIDLFAKHLDAGIPLEPSLPLQLGNILEEHG